MERRSFLKAGAAGLAGLAGGASGLLYWQPRAHAATTARTFYLTDGTIPMPGGPDVYFRGYSSSSSALDVPGETLIVQEGDTVEVTVVNTLGTTHSFVVDGMVDSGPIAGGETKTISFTASSPGTHLYYDGLNDPYGRLVGLHGGLAVMPSGSSNELYDGSPTFVQQYCWVFNDIDPAWNDAISNGNTPSGEFVPRYFTINGLFARPPGAPESENEDVDAMVNPTVALHGSVGDRTLVRILNVGLCMHSLHMHGNHMEWLTDNGTVKSPVWHKDVIFLRNGRGTADVIYPFELPPDAYPQVSTSVFPMHLHDEMTQTAGGGYYMFGALTDIFFE
ncbi:MAG TPA: multicopper oxidase domain-containing protein [Gammaproteobacteria bacterium]|nr:multicopper oxidase domain-containing protein [Gammaproteobacteria bacterium]